jgi:hypothetical protein
MNRKRAAEVTIGLEPQTITIESAAPGFSCIEVERLAPRGQPPPRYSITVSR